MIEKAKSYNRAFDKTRMKTIQKTKVSTLVEFDDEYQSIQTQLEKARD